MTYCLDTWSVVEWMRNREPAAGRLDHLLPSRPVMSWINVGEVSYVLTREVGPERAAEVVSGPRLWVRPDRDRLA